MTGNDTALPFTGGAYVRRPGCPSLTGGRERSEARDLDAARRGFP